MPASDPHSTASGSHTAGHSAGPGSWFKRVGWLLLIWILSVAALGAVAFGLRLVMRLIGMSP